MCSPCAKYTPPKNNPPPKLKGRARLDRDNHPPCQASRHGGSSAVWQHSERKAGELWSIIPTCQLDSNKHQSCHNCYAWFKQGGKRRLVCEGCKTDKRELEARGREAMERHRNGLVQSITLESSEEEQEERDVAFECFGVRVGGKAVGHSFTTKSRSGGYSIKLHGCTHKMCSTCYAHSKLVGQKLGFAIRCKSCSGLI